MKTYLKILVIVCLIVTSSCTENNTTEYYKNGNIKLIKYTNENNKIDSIISFFDDSEEKIKKYTQMNIQIIRNFI